MDRWGAGPGRAELHRRGNKTINIRMIARENGYRFHCHGTDKYTFNLSCFSLPDENQQTV